MTGVFAPRTTRQATTTSSSVNKAEAFSVRFNAIEPASAKARASLDRSSRTSTAGKRRKKPRVAKDTAAAVLERLVADAGGVFAFWGRGAWRSTLALEEAVAEALCPTPAPPPTPSPE